MSKKIELTQHIFKHGAHSDTYFDNNNKLIYEKTDYFYKKNVQIGSNNYVINFNPDDTVETVELKYLVIKIDNEYTFTTIQYANSDSEQWEKHT